MTEERTFPICQVGIRIPWGVAEMAYLVYAKRYGTSQSLERLAERGGFYVEEMDEFYPAWRDALIGFAKLRTRAEKAEKDCASLKEMLEATTKRLAELEAQLNTPEIFDFVKAAALEAAHQRERWGTDHDAGKTDADWFWLVGYLAGKALHIPEKRLHHLTTAAAALANWHLYSVGKTNMRPGIEPPKGCDCPAEHLSAGVPCICKEQGK